MLWNVVNRDNLSVRCTVKMGASPSFLASHVDPGPVVTDERILRIVKHVENTDDVEIDKITDKSGSDKGDGFLSDIIDIKIDATVRGIKKKYSWMIKSTPRVAERAYMSM